MVYSEGFTFISLLNFRKKCYNLRVKEEIMEKLLVEKEYKLFGKYLFPALTGTLAIGILIFIDTVFIGRGIGARGLAALNICLPAFTFYCCIGYLFGVGGATIASVDEGRGNLESKKRIFTQSIIIGLVFSVLFVAIQYIYLDKLLMFLGAKGDIYPMAKSYLQVVVFASGLYLMPHILNPFIRNDGNPNLTMIGMVICGIVNLVLDYTFIFIFKWGMMGAALATGIAQAVYTGILCLHFLKKDRRLGFTKPNFKFSEVFKIVSVGLPSFINEISSGLTVFVFNLFLFKLGGELSVASYSIIININYLVYLVYLGVGQAIQPLVSYNYGAGKKERVKKFLLWGTAFNVTYGVIVLLIFLFAKENIILLFNRDNLELRLLTGQNILKYFSATILMGINIVFATYIQAKGQGKISSYIMLSRAFVSIVIGIFILTKFIGVDGVWYATLFAETVTFIGILLWLKKIRKDT